MTTEQLATFLKDSREDFCTCTLSPALISIFSEHLSLPTDGHRGWTALQFLSALPLFCSQHVAPHYSPFQSPHIFLGAQISLAHIPGLGFALPSAQTLFLPRDKTGGATLLKDVDTWHTSAVLPGINIKVRKICIMTLLYTQHHFLSIFQLAESVRCDVTCLCVSTGAA